MTSTTDFQIPSPSNATLGATVGLPANAGVGSLDAYVDVVNRVPMLTAEEESELARRFQQDEDLDAARRLVMSHLRFVVRVARGYAGYGLQQGDLIQEGNIGLMKAVKRFDPSYGVRLVSFAVHWVRAEMHEFIIRNWRIVKVATTKAQRKLFFNLRSQKKRLGWLNAQEVNDVAKELNVSADDVLLMEERLNAHDPAFDSNPAVDSEDQFAPASFLLDSRFEPTGQLETVQASDGATEQLQSALATLDDRSRDIVTSRWLTEPKATLHDLAGKYAISAERIRQIEKKAFADLRGQIQEMPALLQAPNEDYLVVSQHA